ncbi:MAG: hypothetical protein J5830_00170 [Clostridia bacterium]|nr:hypothetical protein [Clostridia bacterium]
MKKTLSILLAVIMTLGMLAGCGEQPEHIHSFGEWTITKNPTCTEAGEQERLCSCGERQVQSIPEKGHSFSEWVIAKPATCTEAGEQYAICNICGQRMTQSIPAEHKNGDWIVDKMPTCAESGTKHKECTVCGVKTESAEIPKTNDHKWGNGTIINAATCTIAGKKEFVCSICGANKVETIVALGHDKDSEGVCKRCGQQFVEMSEKERSAAISVSEMSHGIVDYSTTVHINVTLVDKNRHNLETPALVEVRIVDSKNKVLYHKTLLKKATSKYVEISYDEMEPGYDKNGTIYYRVYNTGFFEFGEVGKDADFLPWTVSVKLTSVPCTLSEYNWQNKKQESCKITGISYKCVGTSLHFYVTGEKTYDIEGKNYSRSFSIGWKLYDSDNYVISNGTLYTTSLKTGEKFRNVEETIYGVLEPGKTYKLVFSDVR